MKSPKEDYEIRKPVVSDPGTREDLLIFLSSLLLVIHYAFICRSNKCTKVVIPDNKRTMAENTGSWSETAQELADDDNLKLKLLIHEFTLSSSYKTSATPGANKLNLAYSWS